MLLALLLALHFGLAAALVYGMDQIALIPWRKTQGAHWTARARLLWPVRKSNAVLFFTVPSMLGAAQYAFFPEIPLTYLCAALAGIVGAILGMWPMARAVFPDLRWGRWLRDLAAVFVIRLLTVGVFVAAGLRMPYHLGWTAVAITATVMMINLWLICGGVLWLLRRTNALAPAPARLTEIVSQVAGRMGLPLPKVWMLRAQGANAFAFPVLNTLAVTEKALDALPDDELAAVCAHEFAHLNEPRNVVATLVLSAFVLLPAIYFKPVAHTWGWSGYFAICGLLILFPRLIKAFRRRLERRADSAAKSYEGTTPGTYARALERLYEINQVPAVISGALTHPNLYDRLLAAGVTPAYPRPAAPPRWTWQTAIVLLIFFASVFPVVHRWDRDGEKRKHAAHVRPGRVHPERIE